MKLITSYMVNLNAEWGSSVAKRGFRNEEEVAEKFRSWREDEDAQDWLEIMGYDLDEIEDIQVENLSRNIKSDIEVRVFTREEESEEGVSIKRAKESANYNQVDKRWIDNYADKWDIPDKVVEGLKLFVGREGHTPTDLGLDTSELKDERRLYFPELPQEYRDAIRRFFASNKERIIRDILKGEEPYQTDWILITQVYEDETRWTLRSVDNAIEELSGEFSISSHGNIQLGDITIQRKGGDNQRETAQMLQFKMRPFDLVEEKEEDGG